MHRLHATSVFLGGLMLCGSLVVGASLLSGAAPTGNATVGPERPATATPTAEAPADGVPTVRVPGPDAKAGLNPFGERNWSDTGNAVHIGRPSSNGTLPVAVMVFNGGAPRTVSVVTRHRPSETTLYEGRPTVERNEATVFVFHEPSTYDLEVSSENGTSSVAVRPGDFDCDGDAPGLAVESNDTAGDGVTATMLYCLSS